MSNCIACGCHLTHPLYTPCPQPLMALNLPRTQEEALTALRYPMNYHVCIQCSHVFNKDFDVAHIPYEEDSNLMYNLGPGWQDHMETLATHLRDHYLKWGDIVVDIGAGDGLFLQRLRILARHDYRNIDCIAYEPGPEHRSCTQRNVETYADYFLPGRDIARHKPDIIVCRHVLEHMEQPKNFVTELAWACVQNDYKPLFVAEVPCIDKGLAEHRVGDFLYEHISAFTVRSMQTMFESSGWLTQEIYRAYNDEVVIWIGRPHLKAYPGYPQDWDYQGADGLIQHLLSILDDDIVFWGGAGKGAAFLNAFNITNGRVVDSDKRKASRYVPGTGQLIEHAQALHTQPAKTVLITTRWRAADIYTEIKRDYPCVETVYVVEPFGIVEYTEEQYVTETKKAV